MICVPFNLCLNDWVGILIQPKVGSLKFGFFGKGVAMQQTIGLDELISTHPFLVEMEPRFLKVLEDCASPRRFCSHQLIFQEGGDADHFYLIVSGKVILQTYVPGDGAISIQTLEAGDALGWSWLFPPYRWCFSALTAAPTDTISFGADCLRRKVLADPQFGNELLWRVTKTLTERLQATRRNLVQMYSKTYLHALT